MLVGISFVVSAVLTGLFIFLNFDKKTDQKVLMEGMVDGFAGLVLFTYPQAIDPFLLIDISFWTLFMGALYLGAGLLDTNNKKHMWFYSLVGIILTVLGFVLLNYEPSQVKSAFYVAAFILISYGLSNLYLMYKKKSDIY